MHVRAKQDTLITMRRAFVFDLDDTLTDTVNTKIAAIVHTGKTHFQAEIDPAAVRKLWGKPFSEIMRASFPQQVTLEDVLARYREERDKFPSSVFPGTIETLRTLTGSAVLGMVTSHTGVYLHHDLELAGIPADLFAFIHAAEDTPFHKPDPRVFDKALQVLETMNIPKEKVAYVGDSLTDYEACRDAGISFLAIPGRTVSAGAFSALGVKMIPDITGLLRI